MLLVSSDQMRRIDHYAIEQMEIPSIVLMENAALAVISNLDLQRRHTFAVFCGTGNNGGDGLAIARGLINRGKSVTIYIIGEESHGSPDFKTNLAILRHMRAGIKKIETLGDIQDLADELKKVNTIIDAILGTGLDRPVRELQAVVIEQINESRVFTISIDLPSGLDGDTGKSLGACVEPSAILTLEIMKKGLYDNPMFRCPIRVLHIGIPDRAKAFVLGEDYFKFNKTD